MRRRPHPSRRPCEAAGLRHLHRPSTPATHAAPPVQAIAGAAGALQRPSMQHEMQPAAFAALSHTGSREGAGVGQQVEGGSELRQRLREL